MKDEALRLALEALGEINKLSIGENAICLPAEIDTAMDAIKQALEQPVSTSDTSQYRVDEKEKQRHEPEPVKVMGFDCVCGRRMVVESDNGVVASPPKREWQGLTDDEVSKLIDNEIGFNSCCGWEEEYTRAVEAKLKEKNNG